MKRGSISTRTGDGGTTRLFSGEEVPKHAARIEALGAVDEAVSALGLARAFALHPSTRDAVREVQTRMFVVGAELATEPAALGRLPRRVDEAMLRDLDRRRDELEARVDHPGGFIVPGATAGGAHLDHARSIVRRLERQVARLLSDGTLHNRTVLVWLNRLSDYLWLLARAEEGRSDPLAEAP